MNAILERIRNEARMLPLDEREALLAILDHDLQASRCDPPDVEEAWDEEIQKRVQEVELGLVELIPHEQAMAEMRAHLAAKTRPT